MAAKKRALRKAVKKTVEIHAGWEHWCQHCEKRFKSKRSDAKFCSQSCRQKAQRARKRVI